MGKFVPILVMALVISAKLFCAERDPLEEDRTRADALSEKSGAALVEAVLREVNQGNIWAARKMIEWAMWDHMGQVDFKRLSRWKEDSTTEVGDLKPIQIFAALEANWADRQWSLSRVNREKVILSARDRLEKEPLKNATLKSTLSWLYLSFPPKDLKKSNALAQDACVGLEKQKPGEGTIDIAGWKRNLAIMKEPDQNAKGNRIEALKLYAEAAGLYSKLGLKDLQADCLERQSYLLTSDRPPSWADANSMLHVAWSLRKEAKNEWHVACTELLQGRCENPAYNTSGDFKASVSWYQSAAKTFEAMGDKRQLGRTLIEMGLARMPKEKNGDWSFSIKQFEEALKVIREIDYPEDLLLCLNYLGACDAPYRNSSGNPKRAVKFFEEAARIAESQEDHAGQGECLLSAALSMMPSKPNEHEWTAMLPYLDKTIELLRGDEARKSTYANALYLRGVAKCKCTRAEMSASAKKDFEEAIPLFRSLNLKQEALDAEDWIGATIP